MISNAFLEKIFGLVQWFPTGEEFHEFRGGIYTW